MLTRLAEATVLTMTGAPHLQLGRARICYAAPATDVLPYLSVGERRRFALLKRVNSVGEGLNIVN